ncbi:MAG: CehA/McbA family metallohydrolase domain-containing protein [Terriglobia bacterium]
MGKRFALFLFVILLSKAAAGQSLPCDLGGYKPLDGLKAVVHAGLLEVEWQGERNDELRAQFAIRDGQPLIHELAARKPGGAWIVLGRDLVPEFNVTSGKRRLSTTQAGVLKSIFGTLTPEMIEKEKWNAFWDAPLDVPRNEGASDESVGLPRSPDEIRHAAATFHSTGCQVKTEGARLEISFPGLEMGIFSGSLQFTVYRGSNLLRQEAIAKTDEPSVAYKYGAGLKGLAIGQNTRVLWRDTARAWQEYDFGGAVNVTPVGLRARHRLGLVETGGGSLGFFPSPHKFFFARENEVNLGYVYYRKDRPDSFAVGVLQPERGEGYHPYGVTEEVWKRRVAESRNETGNYALYNAPPGTWQRMAVYFYLSREDGRSTEQHVMAYTHDDVFKPVDGYKVLVSHFHFHFIEMLNDRGSIDYRPPWTEVLRALGINIVILADFHSDSHPNDPGPVRFQEQKVYFQGCERLSDRNFLLIPGEEPNQFLGGHYMMLLPRPVYWSHAPKPPDGQPFTENDPPFGTVYHAASAAQVMDLLAREHGVVWQAHPRTKGSAGYPDAIRGKDYFLSRRFIGASYESLPVDLSEKRLCEARCFGTLDDMSNWAPAPKFLIAEGDTYQKYPDDETYPQLAVNYVRLDRVPKFDEGWNSVVHALEGGDFFATSGEVLFHHWGLEGSGARRVYTAEVEWTFPLEFAELVWSDGSAVHRQIISATGLGAFGHHTFRVPFDAAGKKWVRFAVWDSAGNGAFTQPISIENAP